MVNKTAIINFVDGCPLNPELGGTGEVPFRIFRKGNELWAKPDVIGHKKTIVKSKTLKTRDIHDACSEWIINYWEKELGYTVQRCPIPKKREKVKYTKALKQRTWRLRKELIAMGVLSK